MVTVEHGFKHQFAGAVPGAPQARQLIFHFQKALNFQANPQKVAQPRLSSQQISPIVMG